MATMKKPAKKYAAGGTMTTTSQTTTKPTKTAAKKPKSVSQRIGDINLRDVKNATETALNLSTLGGYGVAKKKIKELTGMKAGGKMKKAANGTSLGMKSVKAGFDKNPGVTRADIITAAKGKAKSGAKMKKAQVGMSMSPAKVKSVQQKTNDNVAKIQMRDAANSMQKSAAANAKNGKSMKKCKYGCK